MKIIFTLILIILGDSVQADTIWSGSTKIIQLYPTQTGLIFLADYSNSISTCDNGRRFQLDPSAADYNVQVSVLVAAFMANKT